MYRMNLCLIDCRELGLDVLGITDSRECLMCCIVALSGYSVGRQIVVIGKS